MTTEPLRPNLPEKEDSWTDLAEDLFGIDFAQTPQSGEFVSPEELLAEDDRTQLDSEESKDPALTEETVEAERSEEAEDSPLSAIEAEAKQQEASPSIQDMPEHEGIGDEAPASKRDRSTDETEKDDTFWDVLNDWNWGEDKVQVHKTDQDSSEPERSRRKSSSFERQKPVSSRIVREEDDFSSVEDLHDEYIDDSDFGAGLLEKENEPISESEISVSADEQVEQAEEPRSEAQKSQRRRRRPRRAKKITGVVETVSEGDEKLELKEESSDENESSNQDHAAEATSRKRSSRRRSSRSRKKRSDAPASERDSQTPESAEESEEFGESILDEELEPVSEERSNESRDLSSEPKLQAKASHRDVPSWEEAISYLLSSKPTAEGDSELKTSQLSTATKDSPESSKSPGRRRRRRR